jgi:hypothetical protein
LNSLYGALGSLRNFFGVCATLSAIEEEWESLVGRALAHRSAVRSYDDGVLVVAVENRSTQQDMNFKKNAIIKAILMKTSLKLKDIRTEIAPGSLRRSRPKQAERPVRRRRPEPVRGFEFDMLKAEILEQNPGLGEKLAESIAICRGGSSPAADR